MAVPIWCYVDNQGGGLMKIRKKQVVIDAEIYKIGMEDGSATLERKEKIKDEISNFITMYAPDGPYRDDIICGWDATPDIWISMGEHVDEYFDEYRVFDQNGEQTGRFHNQITSCIRAGLDIAVPDMSGGGVIGFIVGDVRAAYNGSMPGWLIDVLELKGDELDDTDIWL